MNINKYGEYYSTAELCALLGWNSQKLFERERSKLFPARVNGLKRGNSSLWLKTDVDHIIKKHERVYGKANDRKRI